MRSKNDKETMPVVRDVVGLRHQSGQKSRLPPKLKASCRSWFHDAALEQRQSPGQATPG